MEIQLEIIPIELLKKYKSLVNDTQLRKSFRKLKDAEISTGTFSFFTSVSSVFSSKIEGEEIELDSYIKHKRFGIEFLPDYTKKIDDLYGAYIFAQKHTLNKKNISYAHKLLSKHIVARHQQGKIRTQNMYVLTPGGRIEYVATVPSEVVREMDKFYSDVDILLKEEMSILEVFFFCLHDTFNIRESPSLE